MAETRIAWADFTFNPVLGCVKVSDACTRCYAAEWAKRYARDVTWGEPGQQATYRRTAEANWRNPIKWNARVAKDAPLLGIERPRVFCASLADVFDNGWDQKWRADLWDLIRETPNLDWLLLTKRPQNMPAMLPLDWGTDRFHNVWLGTTVENQEEADRRIPHLLAVPARVHFLSCEPLLGPVNITKYLHDSVCLFPTHGECNCSEPREDHVGWVIIGGESGHGFRTMSMEWVASLRVQCRDAGVPVFFKQDSSTKPGSKGRASDALWNTRQFPKVTT